MLSSKSTFVLSLSLSPPPGLPPYTKYAFPLIHTTSPYSPANETPLLPSAAAATSETAGEYAGAVSYHQTSIDHLCSKPNSLPGQPQLLD